jgi:hypothetical protein
MDGRNDIYESILVRKEIEKPKPSIPEAFLALMRELNALGLDFCMQKIEGGFYSTTEVKTTEKDIFTELEDRLKLRTFISRKKNEELAKLSIPKDKKNIKNDNESFDIEKVKNNRFSFTEDNRKSFFSSNSIEMGKKEIKKKKENQTNIVDEEISEASNTEQNSSIPFENEKLKEKK